MGIPKLYHGGLPHGTKLSDIDLFRIATKQGKHGREYAGFYMTDKKEEAEHYISSMNGGCLFEISLSSSAKLLEYDSDITRIKKSDLQEYAKDYDVMVGKNVLRRKEYVLLNKSAVSSFKEIDNGSSDKVARIARNVFNMILSEEQFFVYNRF